MNANKGPKKLNRFTEYLPGFIKFYNIKSEYVTPIVFIILLVPLFIITAIENNISTSETINSAINKVVDMVNSQNIDYSKYFKNFATVANAVCKMLSLYVSANLISKIITSVYLSAYIKDLKGEVYSFKSILTTSLRSLKNVVLSSVDFFATVLLGLALLLINFGSIYASVPIISLILIGTIAYVVLKLFLIFSNCVVLDKGKGFSASIKASMELMEGSRGSIFLYVIVFLGFTEIATLFITSLFSSLSSLIYLVFIPAFVNVIARLMEVRLVARMYVDLEYGQTEKEEEY